MNTHKQSVLSFVWRAVLFSSPILLFVLAIEWGLWRSGETWPAARVAAVQYHDMKNALYGRGFLSQQMNLYKQAAIKLHQPNILVLGSSRVMQFRSSMFHPVESSFYNAGGLIQGVPDLVEYADRIVSGKLPEPKIVIVGVDPWWFNPDHGRPDSWLGEEDAALAFDGHLEAVRFAIRKHSIDQILKSIWVPLKTPRFGHRAIGMQALFNGVGFRRDGSLQTPPQWLIEYSEDPVYRDREGNPVLGRIERLSGKFSAVNGPARAKGDDLVASLQRIKSTGVEVVVFFPPFSTEVFDALNQNESLKEWWNYYTDELAEQIRGRGFRLYSCLSASFLNLDDRYMLDGFHPSEVFVGHVLKKILCDDESGSALSAVDGGHLRSLLQQADTPLAFRFRMPMEIWLK
jgi:hypothetical protein